MKPASARPGASARNKAAEEEASLKLIEQMLAQEQGERNHHGNRPSWDNRRKSDPKTKFHSTLEVKKTSFRKSDPNSRGGGDFHHSDHHGGDHYGGNHSGVDDKHQNKLFHRPHYGHETYSSDPFPKLQKPKTTPLRSSAPAPQRSILGELISMASEFKNLSEIASNPKFVEDAFAANTAESDYEMQLLQATQISLQAFDDQPDFLPPTTEPKNITTEELIRTKEQEKKPGNRFHLSTRPHNTRRDPSDCLICWMKFDVEEELGCLPCNHAFHLDCCDALLSIQNTCPECDKLI